MLRRAAWGGQFYPAQPHLLKQELEKYLAGETAEKIAAPIGCVSPHAAYTYSGAIAGAVYARMELPETFIILCPNHTGRGAPLSMMSALRVGSHRLATAWTARRATTRVTGRR